MVIKYQISLKSVQWEPSCSMLTDRRTDKHTISECNIYYFSTATIFARTRLNVNIHLHCLSCYIVDSRVCQ